MGLSVVIITKNEEANLGRCLDSVAFADETIVVDSHSTDRTLEIAAAHNARICTTDWHGYGPAKRLGVAQATQEWVLSIDADEVVTPELSAEIQSIVASRDPRNGFIVKRRTNFLGRWIYHCGWYPDPVLRLFRRSHGNINEAVVHEAVEVQGDIGRLNGELLHYSYPTMESYLAKSNVYTTLGAQEAFRRGRCARWYDLVFRPIVSFITHYLVRQGFRDGIEGLIISVMSSVAVFTKYAKLRQLDRSEATKQAD